MKLSGNRIKMSDGSIRKFKSAKARANFERYVHAIKSGWKPKGKRKKRK